MALLVCRTGGRGVTGETRGEEGLRDEETVPLHIHRSYFEDIQALTAPNLIIESSAQQLTETLISVMEQETGPYLLFK